MAGMSAPELNAPELTFADLGLSDAVREAVASSGYTKPTPIQAQAIPRVLERRDVLGIAQTGTGKTAAFTLPMLSILEAGRARARMPRTLILEPTRELAAQVEESFVKYGQNHKLSVALLIGGVSFGDQDAKITRGVDVLIATPGRLLDHFERGKLLLTGIEVLVIDEADRMLDMGFIPDIERIAGLCPFTRQTLFFTATMPPEIQRITEKFLSNPVKIEVARASSTASTITQQLVATHGRDYEKRDTLRRLVRAAEDLKNGIIFCNRKSEVATVFRSLQRHGFSVGALHGDMDQRARMNALDAFRKNELTLLVASDVAARGLDIPDVSHVFNYDIPHHAEDYVHRIGRTGRAGRLGTAQTLVARGDEKSLAAIEKLIGKSIDWLDGDLSALPPPAEGEERPAKRGRGIRDKASDRKRSPRREREHVRTAKEQRILDGVDDRAIAPEELSEERAPRPSRRAAKAETTVESRSVEPSRTPTPRRDERRLRRPERDDEATPRGFGDHLPGFMRR
jgi:superfamily II DNA/RNA helicase